jgi:acyl carrier protein
VTNGLNRNFASYEGSVLSVLKKLRKLLGLKKAAASRPFRDDFPDKEEIQTWLKAAISNIAEIPSAQIDTRRPFAEYGLDSLQLIELSGNLEDFLNLDLAEAIAWEYPTIELLSANLAENKGAPSADLKDSGESSPIDENY